MAVVAGIGGWILPRAVLAAPQACVVTSAGDIDTTKPEGWDAGSLRKMLLLASNGDCLNNKITISVPKITMNAPLGVGVTSKLKGLTIEPATGIAQVELLINYSNPNFVPGCSAATPFLGCFAYLPLSNVSIRNLKISVDPASQLPPTRGLCIDKDIDKPNDPSSENMILIEDSVFDGFIDGGVSVSASAYGVAIHRSIFLNSGDGIVLQTSPAITVEAPDPPVMGSDAAVALADKDGKVLEYHLRGLATVNGKIKSVELYERKGKAGSLFVKECAVMDKPVDGWNVDCVLPKTITLPYDYAATVTNAANGSTSMFATGSIPVDVKKVQSLVPLPAQPKVDPPAPKVDPKNPPVYQKPAGDSGGAGATTNETKPITLKATSGTSGGCSLIR